MTTIITKNGNGVPPTLEVGELAIDKSEPALYTNTGSGIEKIGGGKSGGGGGGRGVSWWANRYKAIGPEHFIRCTVNGVNKNLQAMSDAPTEFFQQMQLPSTAYPAGESTMTLTPTAKGGNTIGVIFSGNTPSAPYTTRIQIFVDGRNVYDNDEMFEGNPSATSEPQGVLIGGEITVIWTLSRSLSSGYSTYLGYMGTGIS